MNVNAKNISGSIWHKSFIQTPKYYIFEDRWLFTIYMEKPVGRWFVQMESKIPILEISVWGGVYHLNNRPNLPKEPRTSLDIFKMAAELVLLSEVLDASIDEELLLDHEEDEEFQVIAATSAFMKRELKRNVGFCEVVVPSYSIEEFKSHFRMAWNWFRMANGKHMFGYSVWEFWTTSRDVPFLLENFRSGKPKRSYHLHPNQNFQNFLVNGKQRLGVLIKVSEMRCFH